LQYCHSTCVRRYPSNPPVNQLFDLRSDGTLSYTHDPSHCVASTVEGAVRLLPCAAGDKSQMWTLVNDGIGASLIEHKGSDGVCVSVG
jgi:hypothetical protein